MLSRYLLPGLLLVATACRHTSPAEPTIDFGPAGGISPRNSYNLPVGKQDPTDWTTDATWSDTERQLFANLNLPLDGPQVPAETWRPSGFPNPAARPHGAQFALAVLAPSAALPTTATSVSLVVVDAHYKVLDRATLPTTQQQLAITLLTGSNYSAPATYRVYYVVHDATRVYYRGHGDMQLDA